MTKTQNERPTEQLYQSLLQAYEHFNQDLFSGMLPDVLIVLQRQPKTMGYVSPKRWQDGSGSHVDELAVNPEYFLGYPLFEVFQTLVHEQVHIWQGHFGTPGRRGYHNAEWSKKMARIGLMPSDTGRPGGRRTGEKMSDYVILDGPFYEAAGRLLAKGFALPWIDRRPIPATNYSHAVYTAENAIAQINPDPTCLPLYIPLGATIHAMAGAELDELPDQPGDVPHSGETNATGEDGVLAPEAGSPHPPSSVPTSASISNLNNVRLTAPVIPVKTAAKRQPTRAKYTCECGTNIWGRPNLSITCNSCESQFDEQL